MRRGFALFASWFRDCDRLPTHRLAATHTDSCFTHPRHDTTHIRWFEYVFGMVIRVVMYVDLSIKIIHTHLGANLLAIKVDHAQFLLLQRVQLSSIYSSTACSTYSSAQRDSSAQLQLMSSTNNTRLQQTALQQMGLTSAYNSAVHTAQLHHTARQHK